MDMKNHTHQPCNNCIEIMAGVYICYNKNCNNRTTEIPVAKFKRVIGNIKLGNSPELVIEKFSNYRSKIHKHFTISTESYIKHFGVDIKIPALVVEWQYRAVSFVFMLLPLQAPYIEKQGFAYQIVAIIPKEKRQTILSEFFNKLQIDYEVNDETSKG